MQIRQLQTLSLLVALSAAFTLPLFAQNSVPPAAKVNPFSPFSLRNDGGTAVTILNQKSGAIDVDLRGPKLAITTARYDMAAPRITLSLLKGKANRGEATGGVQVAVREPELKRTTNLTGRSAVYSGAVPGKNAKIEITGDVRVVVRSPEFSAPWVTTCTRAIVEFVDADQTRITTEGMTSAGTLNEPAPKPKKP